MNALFKSIGISKQGFHQHTDRYLRRKSEQGQLLILIGQLRSDHPTMGMRDMYYKLRPESMGRDSFEVFCKSQSLMSRKKKNLRRTTDSSGVIRFDNLIENMKVSTINQVWQSDITYFEVNRRFYYITFIIDGYSRKIVGYNVSKRLLTEQTTLPALKMALQLRKKQKLSVENLIFHSDGGGQYYAKEFLKITGKYKIKNSMCGYAWENGKAERINGVIKNNYLIHRDINSFSELQKEVDRSVYLYNEEKPHIKIHRKTPSEFENDYICSGQQSDGEKSATELSTQLGGFNSPSGCGQQSSGSNIAPKLRPENVVTQY